MYLPLLQLRETGKWVVACDVHVAVGGAPVARLVWAGSRWATDEPHAREFASEGQAREYIERNRDALEHALPL